MLYSVCITVLFAYCSMPLTSSRNCSLIACPIPIWTADPENTNKNKVVD